MLLSGIDVLFIWNSVDTYRTGRGGE